MSTRVESTPRSLVAGTLVLSLVVLGLGGAILVVKLRPRSELTTPIDRQLQQWHDAVDADPKSDTAHTGLGLALVQASDRNAAIGEFETAIELNARNWMAPFQLGVLLRETDPSRAVHLLGRASRLAPPTERSAPLIAQGDLLLVSGDAVAAKRAYERAIGDSPFIIEAHLGLAKALEALGDRKGALKEYSRAAEFDPSDQAIADAIARLTHGDDR